MVKTCCFAGHSSLNNEEEIRKELLTVAEKLIVSEGVTEFLVGNYGAFDRLAAGCIRKLKAKYPHIQINLTIPYLVSKDKMTPENYDNIIMADIPENTPRKLRIIKCNEYMVDSSDFLICCVKFTWGGASKTLNYAKSRNNSSGKTVIDIYNIYKP